MVTADIMWLVAGRRMPPNRNTNGLRQWRSIIIQRRLVGTQQQRWVATTGAFPYLFTTGQTSIQPQDKVIKSYY